MSRKVLDTSGNWRMVSSAKHQDTGPGGRHHPVFIDERRPGAVVMPGIDSDGLTIEEGCHEQGIIASNEESTVQVIAQAVDTKEEIRRLSEQERIRHERDQLREMLGGGLVATPAAAANSGVDNGDENSHDNHVLGCRGCCNYQNGKIGIAAVAVSIVGFVLATIASFSCRFFNSEDAELQDYNFGMGAFKWYATSLGCQSYDWFDGYRDDGSYFDFEVGAMTKVARAMGILGTVLGVLALVATLCLSCVSMPNVVLKIVSTMYLISGACVMLIWTLLSDCQELLYDTCKVGRGAAMSIIALCFYVAAAAIVFKIPLYESTESSKQAPRKTVTIKVLSLPDRTKKTIKTTIDEHGNKTIEETIEEPREEHYLEEREVVTRVLPNGCIKTTRTTYDEEGCKIVTETIEPAGSA